MLEEYEEFISLTLRTRSSKKPLEMLERNGNTNGSCYALQGKQERKAWSVPWQIQKNQNLRVFLGASESTRLRMEESSPNYHEDHIAAKGDNSLQLKKFVHKFIPMHQAMKIPAAKAAVDKEWEKLEKTPAWNLTKVRI